MTRRWSWLALAPLALFTVQGCGDDAYPASLEYSFTPYKYLDGTEVKNLELDPASAKELAGELREYFGTPREPIVAGIGYEGDPEPFRVDLGGSRTTLAAADKARAGKDGQQQLQLTSDTLQRGSKVYRQNCLYCHGLNGDGGGPTGKFLNPLPRDFRLGLFKFSSTAIQKSPGVINTSASVTNPCRDDLKRTITEGIPSANMPSFRTLPEEDIDAVVSYVIHLTIRGKVQFEAAKAISKGNNYNLRTLTQSVSTNWFVGAWSQLPVTASPEWFDRFNSLEKRNDLIGMAREDGKRLYLGKGGCYQCHGADGRASKFEVKEKAEDINAWGEVNPPRDLTQGVYRGGSRPIDLYYRIRLGIYPSGMRAIDPSDLSDEEAWKIVQYVLSLPELKYPYSK